MSINLDEVTFANEAFYLAFESKDFEAMSHIWSKERQVICLHPGWSALIGRRDVLDSWSDILSNPQQGQVSFYGAQTIAMSDDTAAVICYEQAGSNVMVATNVFATEQDRLCLVIHQAGFCAHPPNP